jgi:hypothetical protein
MEKVSVSRFYNKLGDEPDLRFKIGNILKKPFPHFANLGDRVPNIGRRSIKVLFDNYRGFLFFHEFTF